jgi:hypothetical protein
LDPAPRLRVPFRASFDCLWCGKPHSVRAAHDLEGFAHLCPECIGRAQDNPFLRSRVRTAIAERARAASPERRETAEQPALDDDWYLRSGAYGRGPLHDQAWQAELDAATLWVDGRTLTGDIVELAPANGWWSPLLAGKGELSVYDAETDPLDRARERLIAHGLRAHLHVRDPWAEPDRAVDALFAAWALSRLPPSRVPAFLALARRWLRAGGRYVFVEAASDEAILGRPDLLDDAGRLETSLAQAGFEGIELYRTGRFFLTGEARSGG